MKLLISRKLDRSSPIFPPLALMLIFFLIAIGMNVFYIDNKLSLNPNTLLKTVLGDEEAFIEPLAYTELFNIVHIETFLYMIVTILTLFIYFRIYPKRSYILVLCIAFTFHGSFGSVLLLPILSYPLICAYLFIGNFLFLNVCLIWMILTSFYRMSKQ